MDKSFGGLSDMKQLPAALFVVDSLAEDTAVKEANFMHIPVISISNTDCNVDMVNYPIVANDASQSSLKFFLEHIERALKDARTTEVK
jgi:small subunit ribosomal protein S2